MSNRLFLFAGYNKECIIDDALVYYIQKLSKCGDIILCMDCDCKKSEIDKIKEYTIHTIAKRHGEYDFGSYKRCFQYAHDKDILKNYDYLYLVNDSVLGPISNVDIVSILMKLENNGNFVGMVSNKDVNMPQHIQSWFVGLNKKIATSNDFYKFIRSVKKQKNKDEVIRKYEIGLSEFIIDKFKEKIVVVYEQDNHICNAVYWKPWITVKAGIPFIKKSAIPHMLSDNFLRKYINNNRLYRYIKLNYPEIEKRSFKLFLAKISGY